MHYAGLISTPLRECLQHVVESCKELFDEVNQVNKAAFKDILSDNKISKYLFPGNKILLNYIPYESCIENLPLLFESSRRSHFFSSLRTTEHDVLGLLSAGCTFVCDRPPETYIVDIFGTDHTELETHILFHLSEALKKTKGDFCFQVFVEKGYIAQKLCNLLTKLDIQKCNWYVEGGVSVKSVVKEDLNRS